MSRTKYYLWLIMVFRAFFVNFCIMTSPQTVTRQNNAGVWVEFLVKFLMVILGMFDSNAIPPLSVSWESAALAWARSIYHGVSIPIHPIHTCPSMYHQPYNVRYCGETIQREYYKWNLSIFSLSRLEITRPMRSRKADRTWVTTSIRASRLLCSFHTDSYY